MLPMLRLHLWVINGAGDKWSFQSRRTAVGMSINRAGVLPSNLFGGASVRDGNTRRRSHGRRRLGMRNVRVRQAAENVRTQHAVVDEVGWFWHKQ